MSHLKKSSIWKASAPRRRLIRKRIAKGECASALRLYNKLPEAVRYDDRLGSLKAAINRCSR